MNSIFEYNDYRAYMMDYYKSQKSKGAFSWREFSKQAKFTSPVFLKLVCEDKANLSMSAVNQVAQAMNLAGFKSLYFKAMVGANQAKNDIDKNKHLEKMAEIAKLSKTRFLSKDAVRYYDSWINPVIRELIVAIPGANAAELATLCHHKVTEEQVRQSIADMEKQGILVKLSDGSYVQNDIIIEGAADEIPLAIRSMNKQMAQFAVTALDDFPVSQRNVSGITMGISRNSYDKIVEVLERSRNEIQNIISEDNDIEQVYRLNLQLFPLTKNKKVFHK